MHTTILIEGRQVGIEVSDAILHTRGDFCGNLHVPLTFDHPISTEIVLKHLRIKLFNSDDLYDALAHGEKAGGLEVIFSILDDPSLDPFPPDKIPNMVELLWVEENMPTRLGEVSVQTMAEEPDSEPESTEQPSGGSGCAGLLLAVVCGLVLLAGLTGCPTKTPTTPTVTTTPPVPGCQVQRLEDAEQAVRQLHGHSQAYVYMIDGDLATCKLEVFYRPDEDSEETLVWSVAGDTLARSFQDEAEALGLKIDPHNVHHVLAIATPEYRPKPDDEFVFSFSIRCMSNDGVEKKTFGKHFRDSKEAKELFPHSLVATAGNGGGGSHGPPQSRMIKPGEESVFVEETHHRRDESENGLGKKRDLVRYRVTVTCLEGGKLPDRDDRANDEGKDEQQPETTEEPSAEERAVAEIKKLGGKVEPVRDYFDADAPARSVWLGDEFEPDWLVVDLTDTQVTDAGLEHLTGLKKLRMLVLTNTQVTDTGVAHLKGLTNLKSLALKNTQVTDAALVYLKGMTELHMLLLDSTQVTDAGLEHLKGMTNLRILYLTNTQVTDAGLVHLKGLTNLGQIHLDGTLVTGPGLEHVKGMTSLRCIALDGTQVTDASLAHLKGLTNLRTLWFRDTQVTDAGVNDLQKSLPECGIYH